MQDIHGEGDFGPVKFFDDVWEFLKRLLDVSIITVGKIHLTVGEVLYVLLLLILLVALSRKLQKWLVNLLLVHHSVEEGTALAISSLVRYVIVFIGLIVILQSTGVDLSSLTVLAGALGIGVGFGLQNIAGNLVSGLIILFERPIKVGDRIEVGTITGDVLRISLRSTVVRTNDNIDVIVPNSEFIMSRVINWSYTDRDVRFSFPVGASYNVDPEAVIGILKEVAGEHPGVLKEPEPEVVFEEFGESSLNFVLRVWSREYITRPMSLRSELNISIMKKFKKHGIEVPFPQRDIHIRNGSIEFRSSGQEQNPAST
jgi:small-conductance mechanosensitive channel